MTQHDDISSVDDAAFAGQAPDAANEAAASPLPDAGEAQAATSRVQQLIREKHAADALAARSMAEASALRERLQAAPRAQDYRAPEDFTRAVAENAVREAGADLLSRQAAQAHALAARAAQDAWAEATADIRQRAPDFDAVAHNPSLPVTPVMADAIRESPRGGEIAYFLGKNPAEAARIAGLPPVSQATAIARLEARIGGQAAQVSRAPEPFTMLSGRSGGAGKPLEEMDFEDYRRARGF